jgi:DNA-binding CsgD family transcriptional regulator
MTGNTNLEPLTEREREVLNLMARGLSNGEIANRLEIGFETAKWHVSNVIAKLGVRTREEAVAEWKRRNSLGKQVSWRLRAFVPGVLGVKVAGAVVAVAIVSGAAAAVIAGWRNAAGGADYHVSLDTVATQTPTPSTVPTPEIGYDGILVVAFEVASQDWGLFARLDGGRFCSWVGPADRSAAGGGCGNAATKGLLAVSMGTGPGYFVIDGSVAAEVARLEMRLGDRPPTQIDLVAAPSGLTTDRLFFAVAMLERPASPVGFQVFDSNGALMEAQELPLPPP